MVAMVAMVGYGYGTLVVMVSPSTTPEKRSFTRATPDLFESLTNSEVLRVTQRFRTRLPHLLIPLLFFLLLLLRLFILPYCMTWFSILHLYLLSPCAEPAKQKVNYYGWVKEYDGSGLCMCACASVHVNMSVCDYLCRDWDSVAENLGVRCFTPFYVLTGHYTHGLKLLSNYII